MFASMGYDWVFENCLKHELVHGDIPQKKAKLDSHWLNVHWFYRFDTQCLEQILVDHSFFNSSASTFLAKDANLAWRS